MGVVCSTKRKRNKRAKEFYNESQAANNNPEEEEIWNEENLTEQLDKLLRNIQEHNLKRMKDEINHDMNTFILNNLLMCIQFFDNFERAKEAASQFKRQKESEMNEKLAQEPHEGMILGERRCHLLHGMGHVVSKNYIYRSPDSAVEEEYYGNHYYGSDPRNTFMCEGILPLEFIMTWDNLEVYHIAEFETLQAMHYSSAKGSPPTLRFCMEEPDKKNNVPRGYIRLRSVDGEDALNVYKPPTDSSYDYTYVGRYSDKASEAHSDTDSAGLSDFSGSDIDQEEFFNNIQNRNQIDKSSSTPSSTQRIKSLPFSDLPKSNITETAVRKNLVERLQQRRSSGVLPQNYPRLEKPSANLPKLSIINSTSEPSIPSVKVNVATPPVGNNSPPSFGFGQSTNSLQAPHSSKYKQTGGGFSRSTQFILNGTSSSSGYETSQARLVIDNGMQSRSSSIASEEVRHKWQQVELKQLWQFGSRNRARQDEEIGQQDPLSAKCFIQIKHEVQSSDEEESEEDSDSEEEVKEIKYDTRNYLNSTQLSSEYCSEFHYIGIKHGVPVTAVSSAVVLGTTVRCAVEYVAELNDEENFHIAQTYTPALNSKEWPSNYYFWFNQRMFSRNMDSDLNDQWPSADQVERIEKLGVNAVPLGFRSLQFFNTQQSLEWQLNFCQAETLLLNSLKHVHWRAYLFSSLIFRAFLAPLGPQGIGIEHIRNVLYFMCHEDFVGWNDEQPGVHLRAIVSKLFHCLGKGKMPNFFIQSQDLLKSIPPQNVRLVQAHLSHLRDNLIIYCIYAFRNLTSLHPEDKFYPIPNLKKLYKIITVPHEKDLLQINNPGLAFGGVNTSEDESRNKQKKRPDKKKKSEKLNLDLLANEDNIEGDFRTLIAARPTNKADKTQSRLRRKHLLYQQEQRDRLAREKELKRLNASPDSKIPTGERRKSIDLQQLPIIQERFSTMRKVLVIEFFIKHFIKMATQSNECRAYSQSSMYVMQVENLCEILLDPKIDLGQTSLDALVVEDYKKQCEVLRQIIGKEMREYILARFSHLNSPYLSSYHIINELNKSRGAFLNNWDFRKLPTPPHSQADPTEFEGFHEPPVKKSGPTTKRLETPNIAKSLQSITPNIPSANSSAKLARRAETIKFIDKPVPVKQIAPRQSIMLIDEFESTDL